MQKKIKKIKKISFFDIQVPSGMLKKNILSNPRTVGRDQLLCTCTTLGCASMVRKRSAKARVLLTSSSSSSSSSDDEGAQEVSPIAGDGGDGSGSDADAGGAQVG